MGAAHCGRRRGVLGGSGECRGISSRGLRRVFLITYYCCYYGWSLFASLGTGQNGYIVFRRPVAVNKEPATVEEGEEEGEQQEEEQQEEEHKQQRSRNEAKHEQISCTQYLLEVGNISSLQLIECLLQGILKSPLPLQWAYYLCNGQRLLLCSWYVRLLLSESTANMQLQRAKMLQ